MSLLLHKIISVTDSEYGVIWVALFISLRNLESSDWTYFILGVISLRKCLHPHTYHIITVRHRHLVRVIQFFVKEK